MEKIQHFLHPQVARAIRELPRSTNNDIGEAHQIVDAVTAADPAACVSAAGLRLVAKSSPQVAARVLFRTLSLLWPHEMAAVGRRDDITSVGAVLAVAAAEHPFIANPFFLEPERARDLVTLDSWDCPSAIVAQAEETSRFAAFKVHRGASKPTRWVFVGTLAETQVAVILERTNREWEISTQGPEEASEAYRAAIETAPLCVLEALSETIGEMQNAAYDPDLAPLKAFSVHEQNGLQSAARALDKELSVREARIKRAEEALRRVGRVSLESLQALAKHVATETKRQKPKT